MRLILNQCCWPISANPFFDSIGQTRTSADVHGKTASPLEADMPGSPSDVAEVPTAVVTARPILASFHPVLRELFGDACVDRLGRCHVGVAAGRIALALLCDSAAKERGRHLRR